MIYGPAQQSKLIAPGILIGDLICVTLLLFLRPRFLVAPHPRTRPGMLDGPAEHVIQRQQVCSDEERDGGLHMSGSEGS